ncbi:MAG TPA: hypothetical protein VE267_10825, partial [Bradyrhizobium sp.]|nr:hypothetical protein [Bradyrhizobium sp.]
MNVSTAVLRTTCFGYSGTGKTALEAIRRMAEFGLKAKKKMTCLTGAVRIAATAFALYGSTAWGQSPKELKTKSGTSVVLVNFVNPRADCSASPGPIAVPVVREKPAN